MESIPKPIYFNALKRESDPFLPLSATSYGKNFFLSARSARSAFFGSYWDILSYFPAFRFTKMKLTDIFLEVSR